MYSNYSTNLKLVVIVLTLISSISFGLSLNTIPTTLNFNKFAFAQQNPVLPNYKGNHRAIEPSNTVNNRADLASSEIQPNLLVHYQPITPTTHSENSDEASLRSFPTSTTDMINSTTPSSLVQSVSLTHYQPITPADSTDSLSSPDNSDNEHASTNDGGHHSGNDNGHDGESHSDNAHHESSSSHNNDGHSGSSGHHSSGHFSSHHHGAFASAGSGGAFASAGSGGAFASAG
jgi:hypothetical protein